MFTAAKLRAVLQRKNGSWPAVLPGEPQPESTMDSYHRIHPTWVAMQSLRDRDFRISDNQFWPEFMGKLLVQVKFGKLRTSRRGED